MLLSLILKQPGTSICCNGILTQNSSNTKLQENMVGSEPKRWGKCASDLQIPDAPAQFKIGFHF